MTADFSKNLSEQDYLDILSFIEQAGHCTTRLDLQNLLKNNLLTLIDASACFYCFTDPDFSHVQILDTINIPESIFPSLQELIMFDPMSQRIIDLQRPVMAYDVDFPRQDAALTIQLFFQNHPEYKTAFQAYWQHFVCSMGALNLPDATIGVGIHRLLPKNQSFTTRDTRIMELIRPALMHTIRSLVLSDELKRYRAFADCLASIDSPLTLIQPDWRIVYSNKAFSALWPFKLQHKLPKDLIQVLVREIHRCSPNDMNINPLEIPFYQTKNRSYRPVLARIEVESGGEWLWLLRLNRVVDNYSKMLRKLQESTLSAREIEVCFLIRNDLDTREIAERLCISYNTMRNHIGNIYSKTNLNSRSQLIAFLINIEKSD